MSHTSDEEFSRGPYERSGETVQREARDVADTARAAGERVARTAREEAGAAAESGKEMVASRLDNIVAALHASGDELQHRDDRMGEGVHRIAEQVRSVARHVHSQDLEGLGRELSSFARRNPGAFLGAAALLGFAVSRLATMPEGRERIPGEEVSSDVGEGGRL